MSNANPIDAMIRMSHVTVELGCVEEVVGVMLIYR